jgi:hypothetical protein
MNTRTEHLRDATRSPLERWVISPSGRIMTIFYGAGLCNGIVDENGDVLPNKADEGFLSLHAAYMSDDLGVEGWNIWRDAQAARGRGDSGAKLPDEYIPAIVHERRAAVSRKGEFKLPALPGKGGKPKPQKKAKATDDN